MACLAQSRTGKRYTGSKSSMAGMLAEAAAVVAAAAAAVTGRVETGKKEQAWYSHVEAGEELVTESGRKTAWRSAAPIVG